jgi:hypothetical protein
LNWFQDDKSVRDLVAANGRPETVEDLLKQIGLEVKLLTHCETIFFKFQNHFTTPWRLFFPVYFYDFTSFACSTTEKMAALAS